MMKFQNMLQILQTAILLTLPIAHTLSVADHQTLNARVPSIGAHDGDPLPGFSPMTYLGDPTNNLLEVHMANMSPNPCEM